MFSPTGRYAQLLSEDSATSAKLYIPALCPAGTYSQRTKQPKTIKTGCEQLPAGYAGNSVGLASADAAILCPAGMVAREGAAMCLPVRVCMCTTH